MLLQFRFIIYFQNLLNIRNNKTEWGEDDYSVSGTGIYDVHFSNLIEFKMGLAVGQKYGIISSL